MFSKALVALAAASLVGQTVAAAHQHGHGHIHQRRAVVTELVTVTNWVTVTVTEGQTSTKAQVFVTNKAKPQISSSESAAASPVSSSAVPTTLIAQVKPTSTVADANTQAPAVNTVAPVDNTPTPAVNSPAPASSSSAEASKPASSPVVKPATSQAEDTSGDAGASTGKRGLAYNKPELLQRFISSGTKVSWTYNWGQYDDSGIDLEFCPMLWGLKLDFAETWPNNAQKAIDAGSKCLLSFNEPDLGSQANMSPELSAQKHIELMNPFSGKAKIGSPAITNSGSAGQGIDWMKQFFNACGGNCAVDFVNIHIYGVDTNTFLAHLLNVHNAFQKPVWITEFAFGGSDDEINSQLATVIDQIENNSTYSFVERYAYFMVEEGAMARGNTLSTYGNTFAYGA